MRIGRLMFGVYLIAIMGALAGAREKPPTSPEQTHFSAESEGVDHPLPIPDGVLTTLEKDDMVRTSMEGSNPPVQTPPSSWFSAAKVHLADPGEDDLVVLAQGELRGANVIVFWVFRKTASGYELVLQAPAHDLEISRHFSNGYRDIEMASMTAVELQTVLYRFDGNHYVMHRERRKALK